MTQITWLPPLIKKTSDFKDLTVYIEFIYAQFKKDFVGSKPCFRGRRLGLKRLPLQNGKEATFWHMITAGEDEHSKENERVVDQHRCERIAWPAAVINNSRDIEVKCWKNRRGSQERILLWLVQFDYLVVLTDRGNYILPWTAYPLDYAHTKKKLEKEYNEFLIKQGALP